MPKVPTYDEQQVQARPLPGARQESVASPELFDASGRQQMQLGAAMRQTGGVMMDIATRMQDQENADKVFQSLTDTKDQYRQFEQSARERRGDAAKGLAQDAAGWWDKAYQDHADGLTNDAQRRAYRAQIAGLRDRSLDNFSAYEADQRRDSLNQSAEASIVGSVNLAAGQVGTPTEAAAIAGARSDILKHLGVQRQLNRWSDELYTAKQAEALTIFHKEILQNKVDKDPAGARKYFELNKGEINGSQYDTIDKMLKAGGTKSDSLNLYFEAGKQAGGLDGQRKYVDELFKSGKIDADVHDMTTARLEHADAERRSQMVDSDKAMIGQAWDLARQGKSIADLDARTLAYIKQRGLGSQVDSIFSHNSPAQDDAKLFNDLMRQSAEDPAGFTKQDLSTVSGQLSQAHWNHLVQLQTSINRQDLKTMEANKLVHDTLNTVKSSMVASGLMLNPKPDSSQAADLEKFTTNLHDALISAQQAKPGVPLTRDEARGIALGLLKDQSLAGTGVFGMFETHLPVWKMTPEQQDAGRWDISRMTPEQKSANWTIPADDRQQIVQSLRRGGLPLTEQNIQKAYKLKKGVK